MDNIFYHVNKLPRFPMPEAPGQKFLKVGGTIRFGENDDQFFLRIKTLKGFEYLDDNGSLKVYPIKQFIDEVKSGEYKNSSNWPEIKDRVFGHYQWVIHELTLEAIRVSEFPDRPSRFKCLWLSSSFDNAKKWAEECAGGHDYQILKVCADGKLFRCNASLLSIENKPTAELIDNMRLYWEGVEGEPLEDEEILFIGDVKVLEVLPQN